MLKYYEYLHRIRTLAQGQLRDRRAREPRVVSGRSGPVAAGVPREDRRADRGAYARRRAGSSARERYYIHKTRPFFVGGRIYYEVTFYRAVNRVSKSDRIIGFTDIDMTDKYSANLTLQRDSIEVLGQTMPITIIRDWEVSIRPCEFDNFARTLRSSDIRTASRSRSTAT